MRLSIMLDLIWNLAAKEAISANFKDIEPEHVFMALLKVSELQPQDLSKLASSAEVAREAEREVSQLRGMTEKHGLDSTRVRRKLREVLGHGQHHYDGGVIHRAQATREMFDASAMMAADNGGDTLTAVHLCQFLLKSPTERMRAVIGEGGGVEAASKLPPKVAEFGEPLKPVVSTGPKDEVSLPLLKVLAGHLRSQKKLTILITKDKLAARAAVEGLDAAIRRADDWARPIRNRRIIDMTGPFKPTEVGGGTHKRLLEALEEACGQEDLVFLLSG
ncbi:MAG: hypothetical protein HZB13_10500, partial [Acidobacteria bacterium]|nr:hypothetical protein [Acidobacteriota bacterium]